MQELYEVGDVVKLRSGGPSMTVVSVVAEGVDEYVDVVRFENEKLKQEKFHYKLIYLVDRNPVDKMKILNNKKNGHVEGQ